MNKKIKIKQKAAQGLNQVVVPQPGNDGQVLSSALSLGQTGFAVGGPIGAGVGAVVGGAIGLMQKNKQDKANKKAKERNAYLKASRAYDGQEESINQNYQQYALGGEPTTKPIEVEKDELIFRKIGGKFKLKADFKGGKPHSKGGEDYQAQEGDIIFPGKQRNKVLSHLKNNNHMALEGMRLKLPKDVNPEGEAKDGVRRLPTGRITNYLPGILPTMLNPGETEVSLSAMDKRAGFLADGQPGIGMGEYNYAQDNPMQASSASASATWMPTTEPGQGMQMSDASQILQYASVANNLIQGLSSTEKVEENYYNPQLLTYQDRSQPLRNQAMQTRNSQFAGARNSSGGNVQVQRAVQAAADNNRMKMLQQIDNQEQMRADQIDQTNAQLRNQAEQINAQKRDQYGALNMQADATRQQYLDYASSQLSSLGNVKEQQKYQKSRDAKADAVDQQKLNILNQQYQYIYNPDGTITFTKGGYVALPSQKTVQQETTKYDNLGRVKGSNVMRRKPSI